MRHVLRHLALLVMAGQALGGAASLLAALPAGASTARAAAPDGHACCKGMAPGQACPMHKTGMPSSRGGAPKRTNDGTCRLTSGCAPRDVALTGVGSQGALVPVRTALDPVLAETPAIGALVQRSSNWIPSSPPRPPRA